MLQRALRENPGGIAPPPAQRSAPPAWRRPSSLRRSDQPARARIGRVALWMAGTLLSFSVMALSVRALAKTLSTFEILSVRSACGLLILLGILAARPELRHGIASRRMGLHLARNGVQFVGQILWVLAVASLPFATMFALELTVPVWAGVLAVLLLGERMTMIRASSICLCLAGVLVILHPGFDSFQPGALLPLGAAVAFAFTLIATKKLTTTESTFSVLFWMNLMQLPINLAGSDPLFVLKLGPAMMLPLVGIAVAGLSAHYCYTNAFRHGDATIVIPLDFLRVPLIALAGWSFYDERLEPLVFAGSGLILAGIVWNLHADARRA